MNANYLKAYKEGYQDFYDRDFIVTPDVLIPRPETEAIIDAVLNLVGKPFLPGVRPSDAKLPQDISILDVGTGSGCIAITLALELPKAKVTATDISEAALKIAQKNATKFGVSTPLIISNLLENVKFTPDVIVANLPYVDQNWDWLDKKALSYEPATALYAEDSGLKLIKRLLDQAGKRQIKYLVLESDPSQHGKIADYASTKQYGLLETRDFVQVFTYRNLRASR